MLLSASLTSLGKQADAHCSLLSHPAYPHSVLFAFLDELTTKLSITPVSAALLAKAKATHPLHKLKDSVVSRPETTAHIEAEASNVCSPESSTPEVTQASSIGRPADSDSPEPITNAAVSSTDVVEADSEEPRAVSCETEPGDHHTDTCGTHFSITASDSLVFDDTSSTKLDVMNVDALSNNAQTSQGGDTQVNSCPANDQPKMLARSVAPYDTVLPKLTGPCVPDPDEAVTDAPGQGSCTSLFSGPPSPRLSDEPIAFDVRFDEICSPEEITQAPSSTKVITSLEVSESPIQDDQNLDTMSEIDTSELDIRRTSESDFSPKSFASSTLSTVASASSISASHQQSYGTSDEVMEIEPGMDSFVDTQPVTDSQPHTPTDEVASSNVDFRTLNPSLRPPYRVEYPRSNQITCNSIGMAAWDTYRPTAETDTTEWASQAWTTHDMLDFEHKESRFTEFDNYKLDRSTACDRDPKRLQGPRKFESFVGANPHQNAHEVAQQKVPASLFRPSQSADTSIVPATPFERGAAASTHPQFYCVTIPLNNSNSSGAAEAEVMPDQYYAVQTYNVNAYPGATLQVKEDRRVHAYRHNLHTIAALVVEERNVTTCKSESTDSEPDVIDTSFIPQAVRQHAESQKKSRQAANQGSGQRGKKAKKSKKKTGRTNKERACVEKVLQPAIEEAADIPDTMDKPEEVTDSEMPKDGCEQDLVSKSRSKKTGQRRHRRQKKSQVTQVEQPVLATSTLLDDQTPEKHGIVISKTIGLQDTAIEDCSGSEAPADHCDEAELDTKPFEDASTMECAVITLEPPKDPSTVVLEAADDHVKRSVSDADTEAITLPTCHNAVEAGQDDTHVDASEASTVQPEEDENMSAEGTLPVTVHDTIAETTTDEDTHDGDFHTAAAYEMAGPPIYPGKSTLTPILEEVEPETHSSVNGAGVESCQTVTCLAAPEPAAPSCYREAMGAGISTSTNVEADGDMQLTHFVQDEPRQQTAIEYYAEPAAYQGYPHPTQAYNYGTWPNYDPEPVPNYYHPMEPNDAYHYPFSNQLPEYYTPYYDYEPYVGYSQPQYFEPFYDQNYEFCTQLPLSRYEPNGYATPRRLQVSWKEWQPYAERYPGQPFGRRTHMKEQEDKPWYLQTLGYEEELEEEFEAGNPTQRERTRRSCRKYGL